ncbi:MAG: 50S ribosomal protein L31 [Candidatus Liptonbacteria bacterium]|nr:50S ribosomal protein L31 [Candidatus Liptonbacteria bacterium]
MAKKDIHPEYFPEAKIRCACGKTYTIGATKKEIQVEICGNCHPFYTGEEKLIDTAGRVEKFKKRQTKASAAPKKAKAQGRK